MDRDSFPAAAEVSITNPTGLHARPAVKLAQLAAGFDARVQLRLAGGSWVEAKSVAKVMKLKAGRNARLELRAGGAEAERALAELCAFVRRDFDERPTAEAETPPAPATHRPSDAPGLAGIVAAPGLAVGPLYLLDETAPQPGADHADPKAALAAAIDTAKAELSALAAGVEPVARDIIGFQLSLLDDPDLRQRLGAECEQATPAAAALRAVLDAEIDDYRHADDATFRDRAADLRDLRDRLLAALGGGRQKPGAAVPQGSLLIADELTPTQFLQLDWTRLAGAATRGGSPAGHVALLARGRQVPLLVAVELPPGQLTPGREAVLDARDPARGRLVTAPSATLLAACRAEAERHRRDARGRRERVTRFLSRAAVTADGRTIKVYVNIDHPQQLDNIDAAHCDGIGLARTELLFGDGPPPDEDGQYRVYRRLLDWAGGKPVTVRTLDAGGDKPIPGVTFPAEGNPFLGLRGLRLSLRRPTLFRAQLRALARAAAHGPLKIMLPMVSVAAEFKQARAWLTEECAALSVVPPPLGVMVEVPAAALTVERFAADFFSIGSNDLVQYVLAAGRDCAALAELADPHHPAVLELLRRVAAHGAARDVEVSVCGDMASREDCLAALLASGVRALSVTPAALATVKAALSRLDAVSIPEPPR